MYENVKPFHRDTNLRLASVSSCLINSGSLLEHCSNMFKHLAFQCYLAQRIQAAPQCLVAALSANAARAWVAGCGNLVLCASSLRSTTPNSSFLTLTPHSPFKVWSTTAFFEPEVTPMIGGVGCWSRGLLIQHCNNDIYDACC